MLHVADVERSIQFYELLGFTTVDTDRCTPIGWARLHCDGGAIMFLRAEKVVEPAAQGFLLYLMHPTCQRSENICSPTVFQSRRSKRCRTCRAA